MDTCLGLSPAGACRFGGQSRELGVVQCSGPLLHIPIRRLPRDGVVASSLVGLQLADISCNGESESELTAIRQCTRTRSPRVHPLARTRNAPQLGPAEARTPQKDHRGGKPVQAGVRSVASYQVLTQTDTFALGSLPSGLVFFMATEANRL
jgi:hypothetical protein